MRINNNIGAMNTNRQLGINSNAMSKSMEKLSSGLRVNRAGDDAAGLSVSEKMRSMIKGLDTAQRNAQDGISFIQTAEGGLNEISSMLTRMKELTVQKSNGTYDGDDKANIEMELDALADEIDNIITNTNFNGVNVYKAGQATNITVNHDASATLAIAEATLTELETLTGTDGSAMTVENVEEAIKNVNTQRAKYGSLQNRLEYSINNMATTEENLQAAESRIRDVDMASEMSTYTKTSVLQQAAQSMLAQANQAPQSVLSLIR